MCLQYLEHIASALGKLKEAYVCVCVCSGMGPEVGLSLLSFHLFIVQSLLGSDPFLEGGTGWLKGVGAKTHPQA